LYDSLFLDADELRLHYRTPTTGGNSGSPVFNKDWKLVGLHHSGRFDMPKLNNKEGVYEANEAIRIDAIKTALAKHLSEGTV
jgi:V8-like Glu-specific endopeptidase